MAADLEESGPDDSRSEEIRSDEDGSSRIRSSGMDVKWILRMQGRAQQDS